MEKAAKENILEEGEAHYDNDFNVALSSSSGSLS